MGPATYQSPFGPPDKTVCGVGNAGFAYVVALPTELCMVIWPPTRILRLKTVANSIPKSMKVGYPNIPDAAEINGTTPLRVPVFGQIASMGGLACVSIYISMLAALAHF